ncbi:MAG: DUF5615 family PIN-like protein [Pyrinomonadaceae bacterium]
MSIPMLRLLIDQDLDHDILRGLIRRIPHLDAVTAFEIGLSRATDPELLTWAAREKRVIITHDRTTMPTYAANVLRDGKVIAGLIIVLRRLALHQVLDDLELIITGSEADEWNNVIRYLPL